MKKVLIIGTVLICFLGCNTPKSDVQNLKQTASFAIPATKAVDSSIVSEANQTTVGTCIDITDEGDVSIKDSNGVKILFRCLEQTITGRGNHYTGKKVVAHWAEKKVTDEGSSDSVIVKMLYQMDTSINQ